MDNFPPLVFSSQTVRVYGAGPYWLKRHLVAWPVPPGSGRPDLAGGPRATALLTTGTHHTGLETVEKYGVKGRTGSK